MKQNFKRILSLMLVLSMMLGMFAIGATAAYDTAVSGGYYQIIDQKSYTLCPGAVETELILNNADYTRRQVVHVIEVDVNNENVEIIPGYYGIDKDTSLVENQQSAKLTDMAAYYENNLGYNIVGGMNTDLTYSSQAPRVLVYNGKVIGSSGPQTMLCVYKDADGNVSCEMRSSLRGDEWQAVGCSFGFVVKEGKILASEERKSEAASRSMVGVKADGTLVICQVDGRQSPYSVGLSNYEEGEMMKALGCEWAVNCDGGGSSTFITQREGEDELVMRSSPSDGSERPTLHGVFVVSNAKPTGVFNHANITAEYDYFAPNTSYTFEAHGIDGNGYAAEIPAEVQWELSDASFGTVENGLFISNGKVGTVDVQMTYEGAVVGSKTIQVVNPDKVAFSQADTVLPYGKKLALEISATYGVYDVFFQASCFDVVSSVEAAGSIEGLVFNATSNESVAGTTITATYKYADLAPITLNVSFGKGSEVLWDFEDGKIDDWRGVDNINEWLDANDPTMNRPATYSNPAAPHSGSQVFIASEADGGQVKNGDYSLGMTFNMNQHTDIGTWRYNFIYYVGDTVAFRDVANGNTATSVGMWVYVPQEAVGTYFRLCDSNGVSADQATAMTYTYMLLPDGSKFSSISAVKIPEAGWMYISMPLTKDYHGTTVKDALTVNGKTASIASGGNNYYPAFIQFFCGTTDMESKDITFYIDDITLDYSNAVEDRDAPVISNGSYAIFDNAYALNGQTVDSNTLSFSATVADVVASNTSGLDYTTAAIYVDGNKLPNIKASGSSMYSESVVLADGKHSVCFEIADKLGNYTKLTKEIVVDTNNAATKVTLSGHNDSGAAPEAGSVYYVDLVAEDINAIDSLTTELYLNTANKWELDNIIVADGFEAETSFNAVSNIATITLTRKAAEEAAAFAADGTLASIPVRVWAWDEAKTGISADEQFNSSYAPVVTVDCDVVSSKVTYAGENAGVAGSFDGDISVETMLNDTVNPWHAHTETAVEDVEATCETAGCTGKTYCEGCGSVVNWGTVVPATGHSYAFANGVLVCEFCSVPFNGTYTDGKTYIDGYLAADGWSADGKYYFVNSQKLTGKHLINGKLCSFDEKGVYLPGDLYNGLYQDGENGWMYMLSNIPAKSAWVQVGEDWHYFRGDGYAATGIVVIDGRDYFFEGEQGKCLGAWAFESDGIRYYYCSKYYKNTWAEIDGATFYFQNNGLYCTGKRAISHNGKWIGAYEFDQFGQLVGSITGIFKDEVNGTVYYAIDGELQSGLGLVKVDGDYYYIRSAGYAVSGGTWYINADNKYGFPEGMYHFDENGKMEIINGLVTGDDGLIRYYVDGVPQRGIGLIEVDGDYYYIRSAGYAAANCSWHVGANNKYGFAEGSYQFGADGKMLILNGIVEVNGNLVYYIKGEPQRGLGLIEVDGEYYYVRSAGVLVKGRSWYVDADNEYGFPEGTYQFDENGKMIFLDGMVKGNDGVVRYYIKGIPQKGLGLIEYNGDYYYIRSAGYAVSNSSYYVDRNNKFGFKFGNYSFDADGKMIY